MSPNSAGVHRCLTLGGRFDDAFVTLYFGIDAGTARLGIFTSLCRSVTPVGLPLEEFVLNLIAKYHYLTYPVILASTFIEGETIVILCGAAARKLCINVEMLALFAFAGSFMGDQLYYYIGRKYGAPLLTRWPTLGHRIDWAFHLVKDHPTLFVLSFRFIYGIRNIATPSSADSCAHRISFIFSK